MFRGRNARYGLRGCRIGEASNPGPLKKLLRRLEQSRHVSQRRRLRSRGELIELSSDDETFIFHHVHRIHSACEPRSVP